MEDALTLLAQGFIRDGKIHVISNRLCIMRTIQDKYVKTHDMIPIKMDWSSRIPVPVSV